MDQTFVYLSFLCFNIIIKIFIYIIMDVSKIVQSLINKCIIEFKKKRKFR